MKLPITEAFKLVIIKLYTQLELTRSLSEVEAINMQVSAFVYLALAMFTEKEQNLVPSTKWITSTLQGYLKKYTTIEYTNKWMELSSKLLLEKIDDKIFLRVRNADTALMRMLEKNLMIPNSSVSHIKSNNVSLDNSYSFEVSFQGMEDGEVLTYLVAVLHNAYNRSFYFPGLIDSSDLTTVALYGSSKNELLNPFNEPKFSKGGDIIIDVRQLMPDVVFKLVQWIREVVKDTKRIILIATRDNLQSVNTKVFTGLSVESYLVI